MPHAYLAKAKYKRQTQPTPDHSHHGEPIVASLTLPDGVTVSRTALVCSPDLPIADWKALGRTLSQFEGSIQWWIGDWWHYGFHRYGERKAMATAKDAFGREYAFGTLMNYGYVAGRVETSRRREVLSYSHHYEIAKLEPEEQERWLSSAVNDRLSVAQLRRKMVEDGFVESTEDQKLWRYLYRLERAANISPRFTILYPWERPDFENYLERYFLTHNFLPPGFITKKFESAATFWSKTAQFVRRIESKVNNADVVTPGSDVPGVMFDESEAAAAPADEVIDDAAFDVTEVELT